MSRSIHRTSRQDGGRRKCGGTHCTCTTGSQCRDDRIPILIFAKDKFRMYMEENELWKEVCGLPKTKQPMALWLHLPRDLPSDIKESINANAGATELKKETSSLTP